MKTPGRTDDVTLPDDVRALGRTRIEIVPRDSESVFVYWEVANLADDSAESHLEFSIDIRRESDEGRGASFVTDSRLDGRIVEVPSGSRYFATLSLLTDEGTRQLARSSTLAGPSTSGNDAEFVNVTPGEDGLETTASGRRAGKPIRWNWHGTDSSNR